MDTLGDLIHDIINNEPTPTREDGMSQADIEKRAAAEEPDG